MGLLNLIKYKGFVGGGVSSWNDLTDKPFGVKKEVLCEWDNYKFCDGLYESVDLSSFGLDIPAYKFAVILNSANLATYMFRDGYATDSGDKIECAYVDGVPDGVNVYSVTGKAAPDSESGDPYYSFVFILDRVGLLGEIDALYVAQTSGQGAYALDRMCFSILRESVTLIPDKYLPEPLLTSPGGKKFKLTVDDTGTISAKEVT